MRGFPASYSGRCGNCGEIFQAGTEVAYVDDRLIVVECCGETDEAATPRESATPAPVLPRGKTVADRCDGCFQIPASNGACGCS